MCIRVRGGNMSTSPETVVLCRVVRVLWRRHDDRMHVGHVLPLAHRLGDIHGDEHRRFSDVVRVARVAGVAQGPRSPLGG